MLRSALEPFSPVFAPGEYSTDNAMGVAILGYRAMEAHNGK